MNLMSLEEVKALEATVDMEYPPNRRGDALVLFDNLKQRGKAWQVGSLSATNNSPTLQRSKEKFAF